MTTVHTLTDGNTPIVDIVWGQAENILQVIGKGTSPKTTAIHLNPGDAVSNGTITEFVIARTKDQQFINQGGTGYGRYSWSTIPNVDGLIIEYGGDTPRVPFLFQMGHEVSSTVLNSYEFMRFQTDTDNVWQCPTGSVTFLDNNTRANKISLMYQGSENFGHSPNILWQAKNANTRAMWWNAGVDVVNTNGDTLFRIRSLNSDGSTITPRFSVSNTGVAFATSGFAIDNLGQGANDIGQTVNIGYKKIDGSDGTLNFKGGILVGQS